MVLTCEITSVELLTDEQVAFVETFDKDNSIIRDHIKTELAADDVQISSKQLFIRDVPDQVSAQ